ncbi:MAG: hypothetical protein JO316_22385 [Abitibacteriaceae bacterium]|nr:hypothetical protein [Abditibacteriaceae bacterium]MBV9868113.1 hypothetical protein [Abditibacteriaceae bacterium]
MKLFRLSFYFLAGLLLTVSSRGWAQGVRSVYFWNSAGGSPGVTRGAWGNGSSSEAKDVGGPGDRPLEVITRSFHEGIRFDVNPPVPLAPYQATGLLRLRVRFRETGPAPGAGGDLGGGFGAGNEQPPPGGEVPPFGGRPRPGQPGSADLISPRLMTRTYSQVAPRLAQFEAPPPGGAPGGGFGGPPGGGFGPPGGGFGGPPGGGFGGGPGEGFGAAPQDTEIKRLQFTFMLDKGAGVGDIDINLDKNKADEEGWRFYTLPIKNLHLTPDAGTMIQRLVVTSDAQDTFYIGDLALVAETGDMSVSIRRPTDPVGTQVAEITAKPGPITLVADVEAGTANPIIQWNFDADNAGAPPAQATVTIGDPTLAPPPGQRVDAHGAQGKFDYPNEEQNYRVEVTVRDRSGKKKPVKASLLVKVRA